MKMLLLLTTYLIPFLALSQTKAIVHTWSEDLPYELSVIDAFTWAFCVHSPSYIKASGHIDVHHRGVYGTSNDAVMVALKVKVNDSGVNGSLTGLNIINESHHYEIVPVHAHKEIDPGCHTVEIWMRSASSAAPNVDGLAEIKANYNMVLYEVGSIK